MHHRVNPVALVTPVDLLRQPISDDVLYEKYLKPGEHGEAALFDRVADALAGAEAPELRAAWRQRFRQNLERGAIGAGRIMSAAGTGIQATLINCFVQPVGDCIQGQDDDGYPGIYEALREAAETMRRGGGVGYDFSRIRPKGAEVRGTASTASGPCSYINVFDQSCATVESAGARRGAQMGVLRIDHPDVMEFITAKRAPGRWNNFNVSVAVSDAFMHAVERRASWELVHKARPTEELLRRGARQRDDGLWVYQTLPANELWDTVMQSAYDFAEPGILFLDTIHRDNNLRAIESIEATNPCGEQPLPPYGCCDLGPIILTRFVRHLFDAGGQARFDEDAFRESVAVQVRALDNVLDITHWPLPQQQVEAQAKRRIGVGFTGLGDALVMLGLRYDAAEGRAMARQIAETMRDAAYRASIDLAVEKGAFPRFDAAARIPGPQGPRCAVVECICERARHGGFEPYRHDGGGSAVHRHRHFQNRERIGRLPLRRLQGSVPAGVESLAQGAGHLSAQQHSGRGAGSKACRVCCPHFSACRSCPATRPHAGGD